MNFIKENVKTYILIFIILIIPFIFIYSFGRKNNYEKLEIINDYNEFFSCIEYINNFIVSSANNSNYLDYILDKEYYANNISDNYNLNCSFAVNEIRKLEFRKSALFLVEGKIIENGYDYDNVINDNFKALIKIDNVNKAYSILPLEDDFIDKINKIKKIKIDNNGYNKINDRKRISNEQIVLTYYYDIIKKFNNPAKLYDILTDGMKSKYNNKIEFEHYIEENKNKLSTNIKKYKIEELKNGRLISIVDNNDNYFDLYEHNIMNYKINFKLNNN